MSEKKEVYNEYFDHSAEASFESTSVLGDKKNNFWMSSNEKAKELIAVFKSDTENMTKESAQKFLIGAGIFNEDWKVNENYEGLFVPKEKNPD